MPSANFIEIESDPFLDAYSQSVALASRRRQIPGLRFLRYRDRRSYGYRRTGENSGIGLTSCHYRISFRLRNRLERAACHERIPAIRTARRTRVSNSGNL